MKLSSGRLTHCSIAGATTIDATYSIIYIYIYTLTHRSIIVLVKTNVYGTCKNICFTRMRVFYDHVRDR